MSSSTLYPSYEWAISQLNNLFSDYSLEQTVNLQLLQVISQAQTINVSAEKIVQIKPPSPYAQLSDSHHQFAARFTKECIKKFKVKYPNLELSSLKGSVLKNNSLEFYCIYQCYYLCY